MIEIGGNQRARSLMNIMVEHPNRALTTFVELSKTHEVALVLMKQDALPIRYFWTFFNCCLQIGNNTSLNLSSRCLVKAHNTGSLSNPTRHRA